MEELEGEFESHHVFKAVLGNDLVGSVRTRVEGGRCYVGKLIVHPSHQGRGIGSALMSYVESRSDAAKRFELFTGHLSLRNLRLYERLGYREYRREKVNDRLTMIFMEKRPQLAGSEG